MVDFSDLLGTILSSYVEEKKPQKSGINKPSTIKQVFMEGAVDALHYGVHKATGINTAGAHRFVKKTYTTAQKRAAAKTASQTAPKKKTVKPEAIVDSIPYSGPGVRRTERKAGPTTLGRKEKDYFPWDDTLDGIDGSPQVSDELPVADPISPPVKPPTPPPTPASVQRIPAQIITDAISAFVLNFGTKKQEATKIVTATATTLPPNTTFAELVNASLATSRRGYALPTAPQPSVETSPVTPSVAPISAPVHSQSVTNLAPAPHQSEVNLAPAGPQSETSIVPTIKAGTKEAAGINPPRQVATSTTVKSSDVIGTINSSTKSIVGSVANLSKAVERHFTSLSSAVDDDVDATKKSNEFLEGISEAVAESKYDSSGGIEKEKAVHENNIAPGSLQKPEKKAKNGGGIISFGEEILEYLGGKALLSKFAPALTGLISGVAGVTKELLVLGGGLTAVSAAFSAAVLAGNFLKDKFNHLFDSVMGTGPPGAAKTPEDVKTVEADKTKRLDELKSKQTGIVTKHLPDMLTGAGDLKKEIQKDDENLQNYKKEHQNSEISEPSTLELPKSEAPPAVPGVSAPPEKSYVPDFLTFNEELKRNPEQHGRYPNLTKYVPTVEDLPVVGSYFGDKGKAKTPTTETQQAKPSSSAAPEPEGWGSYIWHELGIGSAHAAEERPHVTPQNTLANSQNYDIINHGGTLGEKIDGTINTGLGKISQVGGRFTSGPPDSGGHAHGTSHQLGPPQSDQTKFPYDDFAARTKTLREKIVGPTERPPPTPILRPLLGNAYENYREGIEGHSVLAPFFGATNVIKKSPAYDTIWDSIFKSRGISPTQLLRTPFAENDRGSSSFSNRLMDGGSGSGQSSKETSPASSSSIRGLSRSSLGKDSFTSISDSQILQEAKDLKLPAPQQLRADHVNEWNSVHMKWLKKNKGATSPKGKSFSNNASKSPTFSQNEPLPTLSPEGAVSQAIAGGNVRGMPSGGSAEPADGFGGESGARQRGRFTSGSTGSGSRGVFSSHEGDSPTSSSPRTGETPGSRASSSTPAKGALAKNQQEAYEAARADGLSESSAKILVANMSGESLRDPKSDHWDRSHMSQGIVQWDPTRSAAIAKQFGKEPKDMTVAEQTKASIWEMKTNPAYKGAYETLTNEKLSNQERMYGVVHGYERPQDSNTATSQRMGHLSNLNVHEHQDADPKITGHEGSSGGGGASGSFEPGAALPSSDYHVNPDIMGKPNYMKGEGFDPQKDLTKFTTKGGVTISAHKDAAPHMEGFLNDIEAAGAPVTQKGTAAYNDRTTASGGESQHAHGNAIDVESRGRNVYNPAMQKWVAGHQDELHAAELKWDMISGRNFHGGGSDESHWEWGGQEMPSEKNPREFGTAKPEATPLSPPTAENVATAGIPSDEPISAAAPKAAVADAIAGRSSPTATSSDSITPSLGEQDKTQDAAQDSGAPQDSLTPSMAEQDKAQDAAQDKEASLAPGGTDRSMMQATTPTATAQSTPPLTGAGHELSAASSEKEAGAAANERSVTVNNSNQQNPAPASGGRDPSASKPSESDVNATQSFSAYYYG